jgi:hypothetical protein
MADWRFKSIIRSPDLDFTITQCTPSFGDAFSPPIPSDKLCTLNWVNFGNTLVYSASMDFIGDYGRGERMRADNPEHRAYEKCVLIAGVDPIEYYCLSPANGSQYMDGEVMELLPDEELALTDLMDKHLFVSDGSLVLPTTYEKHFLLSFKTVDATTIKAGPDGAVVAVFYKLQ